MALLSGTDRLCAIKRIADTKRTSDNLTDPSLGTIKIKDLAAVSAYRFREIPKLSKRNAFRAIAFVRATSHTRAVSSEEPDTMRRPSGLNGKSRQDANLFEELLGLRDA